MPRPEKMAQRTPAQMRDLMEVACLWVAIAEPIRLHVGDAAFAQCKEMFYAGILAWFWQSQQNNRVLDSVRRSVPTKPCTCGSD